MTPQAFTIPARADPDAIERARPNGTGTGDRCCSELLASPFVVNVAAVNAMPDPLPEPDPEERLRGLVGTFVDPMVYDFWHSHPFHAEEVSDADDYGDDAKFRADVVHGVREYAAEMGLDVEAAEAEARRLLEMLL